MPPRVPRWTKITCAKQRWMENTYLAGAAKTTYWPVTCAAADSTAAFAAHSPDARWADGGETSLNNTALLCSFHHRHVHEYGYDIELGPDQRLLFRNPYGQVVTAAPPRPAVADLGWPRIQAMNEPLAINADTIACQWDGKPVDYGAIVGPAASTPKPRILSKQARCQTPIAPPQRSGRGVVIRTIASPQRINPRCCQAGCRARRACPPAAAARPDRPGHIVHRA